MTAAHILWQGRAVPFHPGESVASALMRAGIRDLTGAPGGTARAVFCGIGQCQSCLVRIDGRVTEACLAPCRDGLDVQPETGEAAHG